jgi:hypothetical protein
MRPRPETPIRQSAEPSGTQWNPVKIMEVSIRHPLSMNGSFKNPVKVRAFSTSRDFPKKWRFTAGKISDSWWIF